MSVQISELDVVPRPTAEQQPRQSQEPQPHAHSPELTHEVARAVALLHARDLRLRAD